jgi:hypothetical protein
MDRVIEWPITGKPESPPTYSALPRRAASLAVVLCKLGCKGDLILFPGEQLARDSRSGECLGWGKG